MDRTASAVWHGGLKDGKGKISTQSGVLKDSQYSFGTRFENGIGTNPEELIAAAHAGCFTMALSAQLSTANLPPESIETKATVTFDKTDAGSPLPRSCWRPRPRCPARTRQRSTKRRRRLRTTAPSPGSSRTTPRSRSTPNSPSKSCGFPYRKPHSHPDIHA